MMNIGSVTRQSTRSGNQAALGARSADRQGQGADQGDTAVTFGPFCLVPTQRLLLNDGETVSLGSRALELLMVLVERRGDLVRKEELIARAWPDTFVDPANLKTQVAALRKALGDGHNGSRYLATVPGRGYCFVAPIEVRELPRVRSPYLFCRPPARRAHGIRLGMPLEKRARKSRPTARERDRRPWSSSQ